MYSISIGYTSFRADKTCKRIGLGSKSCLVYCVSSTLTYNIELASQTYWFRPKDI